MTTPQRGGRRKGSSARSASEPRFSRLPQEFLESGRVKETACLILDVRMPGMDGLELQRLLGSNNHRVPIIFVTAQASDDEQRRATQGVRWLSCASLSVEKHLSA